MPISHFYQLNEIVDLIVRSDPLRILDVGVGFGTYGFLSRAYLELRHQKGTYSQQQWNRTIHGIEVFADYLNPAHQYIYDELFVGNALEVLPGLQERYDLVLLIDVLEHFPYDEGMRLLHECVRCGRNVLVATPKRIGGQADDFGNPHETHRFQWRKSHFRSFGEQFWVSNPYSWIVYFGEDVSRVKTIVRSRWLKRVRRKYFSSLSRWSHRSARRR